MALVLALNPRRGVDFRIYLLAAERFVAGEDLYPLADGTMPFKYAPLTAPLFLPLTLPPAGVAVALWNVGSLGALVAVARVLGRPGVLGSTERRWPWAPVLTTLVLLPSFRFEFFYGQVDGVLLGLLTLAVLGAEKGRTWGPAAALAVALLLKPPAGLLVLFFAVRRHGRVLGASVCVGLVLTLPALLRYGLEGLLEQTRAWLATLARTTPPWALGPQPQGLPTQVLSWLVPPDTLPSSAALSLAQGLALAFFLGALAWGRPGPRALFALCCLGVTLLSPLAWRANFLMAWPALLLACEGRTRGGLLLVVLVAVAGVLCLDFVVGDAFALQALFWRPYALVFTALLLWIVHVKRGQARPPDAFAVPARAG